MSWAVRGRVKACVPLITMTLELFFYTFQHHLNELFGTVSTNKIKSILLLSYLFYGLFQPFSLSK